MIQLIKMIIGTKSDYHLFAYNMVQRNMNKSELKEKIRRMKMEIQELEECLDKYEERDNRYDDDPQYRNRNPYDDEERYREREEYGHRERGRYGRY